MCISGQFVLPGMWLGLWQSIAQTKMMILVIFFEFVCFEKWRAATEVR
jgi:hypothetical protein